MVELHIFQIHQRFLENVDEYEFLFLSEKQKNIFTNNMNFFEDYYVLGFDINAFGNRYYNPAAKRNFVLGAKVDF